MKTIYCLSFRTLTRYGYREEADKIAKFYWFRYGDKELCKMLGRRVKHSQLHKGI